MQGKNNPGIQVTNDFESDIESIVGKYACRWRVENGIAETVKFFHLNALSSPILTKIHFDVALTMTANTLYTMLVQKLHGFKDCDAPQIYRHFIHSNPVTPSHISACGHAVLYNEKLHENRQEKSKTEIRLLPHCYLYNDE